LVWSDLQGDYVIVLPGCKECEEPFQLLLQKMQDCIKCVGKKTILEPRKNKYGEKTLVFRSNAKDIEWLDCKDGKKLKEDDVKWTVDRIDLFYLSFEFREIQKEIRHFVIRQVATDKRSSTSDVVYEFVSEEDC
jgi:hypothetical protein